MDEEKEWHDWNLELPRWAIMLCMLFAWGCATQERYLSAEMDAKMREVCEPAGCEIITSPHWQVIEQILSGLGLTAQ